MGRRVVLLGVLAAAVWACGETSTEHLKATVSLIVLQDEYARTDTIRVTLRNTSGTSLAWWGDCPSLIERRSNVGWQAIDSTPKRVCPVNADAVLYAVRDGAERLMITQPIADWIPDGEYRYRMFVSPTEDNDRVTVGLTSNTFRIITR